MTAGVACKFTVHFSTSFSTTRTFDPKKSRTLLSCRHSRSWLRHFLHDFGECRFGRWLLYFSFTHALMISPSRGVYWSIWISRSASGCYDDNEVVTPFSSFRSSDLSQSIGSFPHLRFSASGVPMGLEAILGEVDQLHNVSTRLEGFAEQHPPVSEALVTIAGSVRNTATILAVPVATRSPKSI